MKLLFNPENGATIKNVWFEDEYFLNEKEDQAFDPGMVIKVDSDFADFVLSNWTFVKELTVEEAKDYLQSKEMYKCDKCDFKTRVKIAYHGHQRKHLKESEIDELGIRTVKRTKKLDGDIVERRILAWEDEDKDSGLEGEGLTDDAPRQSIVM